MLARKLQTRTTACNDNGVFVPSRTRAFGSSILNAAVETAGSVSLNYVADGVMIITVEQTSKRHVA